MTVEAVIFDLDNTLVNRKDAFNIFSERLINQFVVTNDSINRCEIIKTIGIADRDGYRNRRELFEELLMTLPMNNPGITIEELMEFWSAEFFKCTVLMDGAQEVLENLLSKKIKLALITNGSVHSQNSKIDQVMIRNYFDTIIVSDEVNVKKPDKRIFDIALERLNISSQFSWYIGDHPIHDIQGAMDAGLNTVWMEGFIDWEATIQKPKHIISQLKELIKIVEDVSMKP